MSGQLRQIRVIGVPRSGTNLVKYLIEQNSDTSCHFNYGWWKHAVIPPIMNLQQTIVDEFPTIILFRDPLLQIASFFKFSRKGRTAISGADEFQIFIKSPILMTPNKDYIEYYFSTPSEYWKQFYHSALRWRNSRKIFIELDELQVNLGIITAALELEFPGIGINIPSLPRSYLGRNPDRNLSERTLFETDTTLEYEKQITLKLLSSISNVEERFIRSDAETSLYEEMRTVRIRS